MGPLGVIGLGSVLLHLAVFWPEPARQGRGSRLEVRLPGPPSPSRAETVQAPAAPANASARVQARSDDTPAPRAAASSGAAPRRAPRAAASAAVPAPGVAEPIQAARPDQTGDERGDERFDTAFYRYTLARVLARQLARVGQDLRGEVVLGLRAEAGVPPVGGIRTGSGHPVLDAAAEGALTRALQNHPPRPGPGQVVELELSVRFGALD
jgi:hypothetical protein